MAPLIGSPSPDDTALERPKTRRLAGGQTVGAMLDLAFQGGGHRPWPHCRSLPHAPESILLAKTPPRVRSRHVTGTCGGKMAEKHPLTSHRSGRGTVSPVSRVWRRAVSHTSTGRLDIKARPAHRRAAATGGRKLAPSIEPPEEP